MASFREKSLNTPVLESEEAYQNKKEKGWKKRLWQKEDSQYAAIVERVRRS